MPETEWLDDGETLTYLHSSISTRRQRVRVPETPMYLDALLPDKALSPGEPLLGAPSAHLNVRVSVADLPGLLDALNHLAFPVPLGDPLALPRQDGRDQAAREVPPAVVRQAQGHLAMLKEETTNEATVLIDTDAANKALDADAALQELGDDLVAYGFLTTTVTVWDEDPRTPTSLRRQEGHPGARLHLHARERQRDEAWLGSLPGHVYANVRQPPISTLNLAHMMPFSAVWAGPERDEHLRRRRSSSRGPGSTPFRFSLMSATSATRSSSARPARASACCWR